MHNEIVYEFLKNYPDECAREIETFSLDDILFFLKDLSKKQIIQLMPYFIPSIAAVCLQHLPLELSKEIIRELPLDALKTIATRIPKELRLILLEALPNNQQVALKHALRFSPQTVGAFMNTEVLFLPIAHHVAQAMAF